MSVQHLATRPRVTPKIIETIIHALPRNDTTEQELNDLVEEIQNVQHRYLRGDKLEEATTKNSELGASSEPKTTHQSKPVPSEKHHWKQGEWSEKYGAIFDKTRIPAQNLQKYLGESLEQIDALVLNTLPDILGKRLLRKFYEDLRWMSAKYYGDPTDDAEFKRLLNKRGSKSEKRARQREKKNANPKNMQKGTVGDAGPKEDDEVVDIETEGGSIDERLGAELEKDGIGVQANEEGAFDVYDQTSLQTSDSGQLSTMIDDHLAKPSETHETATRPNSFSEINSPIFTIKSNSRYLHEPLVVRPASESPLKRKSEANPEGRYMGQIIQADPTPSDTLKKRTSDTNVDQNRGHPNDLRTSIKVEESPTPASLLKRIPQYLEFDHRNMASPEDAQHSPTRIVEVTRAEKRKRAELDTEDREAKFLKIAEEGHISRTSGQKKSDHELAEHGQIEEPGRKIGTLDRPPKLSLERVQNKSTGQKHGPHGESVSYIPAIDLRNSLELSNSGESNSPQERKCLERLLNERLPTLGELGPTTTPKLTRREQKAAFKQNKAKEAFAIKTPAAPATVIAAADTQPGLATITQQNHPEVFLGSPHPNLGSIPGDDGAVTSVNSHVTPVAATQNKNKQRRERQKLVKKAPDQDQAITVFGLISDTGDLTMVDAPNLTIEPLSTKEGNTVVTQTLCSDGELRPRGDEGEEMLDFVGWEAATRSKPGDNGLFNPVELYSKFLQRRIDDNRFGNRTDQAAMLVYVIIGIGSSCAIAQFGKIAAVMREELEEAMEFLPGHERYGRAALRLTLGPDEGPFKPFAESVLALEFYRFLENERAIHGEMLPLTARGLDFTKIQELENSLLPRHGRGANLRALQQIGCRLSKLTSIYGDGILALIPSSGRFGDCLNVLSNMDEASFRVFQQYMDKYHDPFLLKVSPLLEPYVHEGMWSTLNLPKLRLELDGGLDELAVKDRSDQLASMCLPSWACIRLTQELSFQWEGHAPAVNNTP